MAAPKKMLNVYGDIMRQYIHQIYSLVAAARSDESKWDVRGLEFPEDPPNATIETIASAQALDIPSDTLDKEMSKLAADVVVPDANRGTKQKIYAEIDSAKPRAERQLEKMTAEAKAQAAANPKPPPAAGRSAK